MIDSTEITNSSTNATTKVIISNDKMSATLYLAPKKDNSEYAEQEVVDLLHSFGVTTGIDHDAIKRLLYKNLFMIPCVVALGTQPENGHDGFFTYYFRTKIDNKPTILPDGSVDYRTKEMYEQVEEGKVVATYTPPTNGSDGINICGGILGHKAGKDLMPLKGEGFTLSDDGLTYTSKINGRIELKNGSIIITNVLEVKGDVDITYGDIDFNGSVYVQGSVLHGSTISATGDIVVSGNVEDAFLYSSHDIELKSGMTGGGRGVIECLGTLRGKFFESTYIRVQGELHANSLMNCNTMVRGAIYISGRHGIIIGGLTNSLTSISATTIGNLAELKTKIAVGINQEFIDELFRIQDEIKHLKSSIIKIDEVITKIMLIRNPVSKEKLKEKLTQAEYSKDQLMTQCAHLASKRSEMIKQSKEASNASIKVAKYIFPRVSLCVNGILKETRTPYLNVLIKANEEQIEIVNCTPSEA